MSRRAAEFAEVAHGFSFRREGGGAYCTLRRGLRIAISPGGSLRPLPRSSERAKACDSR